MFFSESTEPGEAVGNAGEITGAGRADARFESALFYGMLFLVLALPVVFDPRLSDMWELPKATFLWIGTIGLVIVWMSGFLLRSGESVFLRRTDRKSSALVGIFLLISTLATLTSIHPFRSFFGEDGRYEGLLTLLSYGALYFLATQVLDRHARVKTFAKAIVLVASLLSVYGLIQFLGLDFLSWPPGRFEEYRSFSTLGNPLYFAEYLAFALPLAAAVGLLARGRMERWFYGAATAVILACLATTFTRGAWIGAAAGLAVTYLILGRKVVFSRRVVLLISLLIATFVVVLVAGRLLGVERTFGAAMLGRLESTLQTSGGSTATRVEIWRSSLRMIRAKPLLGWGPDTFRLVFPQFSTLGHYRLAGQNIIADNAHNYFLQLGAVVGVFGVIAFAALFGLFLYRAARPSRWQAQGQAQGQAQAQAQEQRCLSAGLAGAATGYLVSLLFGISIVSTTPYLWLSFAVIAGRSDETRALRLTWPDWSGRYRLVAWAGLAVLLVAGASFALRPYRAEAYYVLASERSTRRPPAEVTPLYEKAVGLAPYNDQLRLGYGVYYSNLAATYKDPTYLRAAIDVFLEAQRACPTETNAYTFLALAYLDMARITGSRSYGELAVEELNREVRLAPHFSPAYYLLGAAYRDLGEYRLAARVLRLVVAKDPGFVDAWLRLAGSYEALGDTPKAAKAYAAALKLDTENQAAKDGLKRLEAND